MEDLNYQVFNQFSDIIRTVYSKTTLQFEDNVHGLQIGYLHFILDHEGCCQQDLVAMRIAGKAAISEMLLHMEEAGLITRIRNKDNRRKHEIFLTDKGRRIAKQIKEMYGIFCEKSMQDFTEDEIRTFLSLMTKFINGSKSAFKV